MNDDSRERRPRGWRRIPASLAVAVISGLVAHALVLVTATPRVGPRERPAKARDAHALTPAHDAAPLRVPDAWRERKTDTVALASRIDRARFRPPSGGIADPPVYAPRDPGEWQGMRVNLAMQQVGCEGSSTCGLAMACLNDGRCGPCEADDQCASGEACVLQHCVRAELVHCRVAADCGSASQCMLTGYTAAARGNEDMRSVCSDPEQPLEEALAMAGRPATDVQGQPEAGSIDGEANVPLATSDRLMDRVLAELAAEAD